MTDPAEDKVPSESIALSGAPTMGWMGRGPNEAVPLLDINEVDALRWPMSIQTFDRIRRDAQAAAMFNSLTVPIRRYPWAVDPNGAEDEVVERFADDVSLPIIGTEKKPIGRTRNRFNWDDHLSHTFLACLYGHMPFEQQGYVEGEVGNDGNPMRWRLHKLFPIMPATIGSFDVTPNGSLVSIRQNLYTRIGQQQPPPIPISQLVVYVWGKEGANWLGRSMLVPVYRHWLIKDRLLRVDAVKHERTGAGVPIVEAPQGATGGEIARLDAMAQRYKVGEAAGGAVPAGSKFRLVGVEGATSDVLASVRYQDEQMAMSFSQEVRTLGQSAYGSRALGETFAGLAQPFEETVAGWVSRTTNEHVVEDWVDWNFGGDYGAPRIVYEDPSLETPGLTEEQVAMQQAQKTLDATAEVAALCNTELAPGYYILNLDDTERKNLAAVRADAQGVIDRRGRRA